MRDPFQDERARRQAIDALCRLRAPEVAEGFLIAWKRPATFDEIVNVLVDLGTNESVRHLVAALGISPAGRQELQKKLEDVLVNMGDAAFDPLTEGLNAAVSAYATSRSQPGHPDRQSHLAVIVSAARIFERTGDRRAVQALIKALDVLGGSVPEIVHALGVLGDSAAFDALRRHVSGSFPWRHDVETTALGKLGGSKMIEPFMRAIRAAGSFGWDGRAELPDPYGYVARGLVAVGDPALDVRARRRCPRSFVNVHDRPLALLADNGERRRTCAVGGLATQGRSRSGTGNGT